jgi:hypothetical protein
MSKDITEENGPKGFSNVVPHDELYETIPEFALPPGAKKREQPAIKYERHEEDAVSNPGVSFFEEDYDPKPVQAQRRNNPLLERVIIPEEIYRIPSRGLLYTNGELDSDVKDGELKIHAMSGIDALNMRSPHLLLNGEAVKKVIKKCVPQVIHPDKLFQKDIDMILLALRKVTYGSEYEIRFKHDCKDAHDHSYVLDLDNFISNTKEIAPTTVKKRFSVTLENGQVVRFTPLRFKEFIKLMVASTPVKDPNVNNENQERLWLDILVNRIDSVDDINDKGLISEWLSMIKSKWIDQIEEALEKSGNWGVNFDVSLQCKDCGKIAKASAPLNPLTFFM